MNTYRVRTKCAERVNISRRKIKKYVEKLSLSIFKPLCPTFSTFHPCFFAEKRHVLYNIIEYLYIL